ncbi:hypothetical protein A4X13_0g8298, partial [Tilletia indica]
IATRTMAEHVEALEAILSTAAAEGLKFSPAKCTFAVGSLILLGRKVSGAGVAVWQDRAAAIRELARPTTLRELYHALGLFGYYRSFVRNFASVAEPLTRLTKGWRYEQADGRYRLVNVEGKPTPAERCVLDWGEAQQRSFEALKDAIASPPVLAHPDPARPYIVYVDASKEGFGVVVHQILEADSSVVSQSVAAAQLHALEFARLPPAIARERWTSWLRADRYFAPILRDAEQATDGASADGIWVVENGVLIRRHDGRLALPEGAIPELLRSVHEHNGHFGFYKTYLALARDFWRSGLSTMVRSWVKHCRVCQATKAGRKTRDLDVTKDSQLPFDTISIDIVHGLPLSRAGNNAAVVVLCTFSRMVLIEPCSLDVTAEGVAAILSNRVLRYEWRPRRIISDSESRLTGAKMTALARSLGASITPSSPYHQQANAVERAIQTIQHVLQSMSMDSRAHWDRRHAPAVELAINSTPSVITGHRPFDLVFVSHPSIVHAVFDDAEHLGVGSFDERLAAACERLVEARELTNVARAEQKRRYDRFHAPLVQLRVGDRVFLRLKDRPVTGAIGDKLDSRKMGPFPVSEVLSDHRVRLELPADVLIDPIVSVEQIDLVPRSPDPFAAQRDRSLAPSPGVAGRAEALEDVPAIPAPADLPIAPRSRRLPALLRGFDLGVFVEYRHAFNFGTDFGTAVHTTHTWRIFNFGTGFGTTAPTALSSINLPSVSDAGSTALFDPPGPATESSVCASLAIAVLRQRQPRRKRECDDDARIRCIASHSSHYPGQGRSRSHGSGIFAVRLWFSPPIDYFVTIAEFECTISTSSLITGSASAVFVTNTPSHLFRTPARWESFLPQVNFVGPRGGFFPLPAPAVA